MKKTSKLKLKEFKDFFLNKKKEILDLTSKKSEESNNAFEVDVGDEMDIAQGITIEDISNKLNQRNKDLLVRINIALKKIDDGSFGLCEQCDENISEPRLKAVPDCRFCINCAELEEKIRKQYRS